MKNLFIGLLMFAGTSFAFANNGEEVKTGKETKTENVSVVETKVVNVLEDDFCSITITRTRTTTTSGGSTTVTTVATGTGSSCEAAEKDARETLNS
jgi:hypothetical protein